MKKLLKTGLLCTFILCIFATFVFAEEITITTYYPSPYGSYNSLQVDKLGVGDNDASGTFTSADVPSTSGEVWIKSKLGIGTMSPGNELCVAGANPAAIPALGANDGQFGFFNSGKLYGFISGVLSTGNVYAQVQRIDGTGTAYNLLLQPNGGGVSIGSSSAPSFALDVNGDIGGDLVSTGSTGYVGYVASGGSVGAYKLVRYSSSRRYKDNIGGFNLGLEAVKKMRPASFIWKSTGERDFGFIAEDAEKVSPDFVTKINGQIEAFKYMAYTAVLTNAIQEQQKQIDGLKAEIEKLKKSK